MSAPIADLDIQGAWDPGSLREEWPRGIDNRWIIKRINEAAVEQTLLGASGKVLEVAAAEAVHSCRLAGRGLECHVLEPSESMLGKAREHMATHGVRLHLVRGIAEALPYPDGSFDRVLIDSAIDHLAAPDLGVREMVRVLKPDGRLVVSFVNYASIAVRVSRLLYRLDRALRPSGAQAKRFWDSPVPMEHTFEATYRNVGRMCGQYLAFDRAVGVSMLWNTPGWDWLLHRVRPSRAQKLLELCEAAARRRPDLADVVYMVWRPRTEPAPARPAARPLGPRRPPWSDVVPRRMAAMRVTPADPVYQRRRREDLAWEAHWAGAAALGARREAATRLTNRALTGDPARSWVDDVAARGPFRHAVLVAVEADDVAAWQRAGGSAAADVVGDGAGRLARVRARLASLAGAPRVVPQDLNFLELPAGRYDVALVGAGINRVANVEVVFDELADALRPGGLVAVSCYVGERRQAYAPTRLAFVNEMWNEIPPRFRSTSAAAIGPCHPDDIAPFRAIRSDDIPAVARARFDVVHERWAERLFPLTWYLDVPALEREAPALLARVAARDAALASEPAATPCWAYLLLRRRST